MSKIDELIEQYCPNGVVYKELIEVADIGTGNRNGNEGIEGGKYPLYVRSKNIKTLDSFDFDEEAIIIPGEGGIGEIFHYINGKYALHQRAYRIHINLNDISVKFIYYFMRTSFKSFINKVAVNATVSSIRKPMIEKFPIPIPPLPIQEEIVNILDKFTQLEAELEAELEARTRQYEFYRNQLLAFEDKEVAWKTLGDIGEFIRGKRFVRTDMIEEGTPCIHYGEMYTHYNIFAKKSKSFVSPELAKKLRVANYGDVVIVAAGETVEDIGKGTAWLGEEDVVIHDACFAYKSELNPKYVSYFLRTKLFHNQIKRHISSGKISAINAKGLAQAKIPVPPLKEQERIVKILDQFDALVNDISVGLPAEIKARRQQYEYYRSKLLTFKNVN
ncbi:MULTISPECIES: restriction endonuclease subunit S [Flavobacterium]|uniref:restriction endonuclease subunit S n=1 Tax=Flavobacterium TaxID=237 RepID=UPI001FCBFE29|nr:MULTISPECIES: restriction endonuclease subunit S [Flavobacterium]UOK43398.1 restriction endonuclease subunit S [Flavobacterium enshiense]